MGKAFRRVLASNALSRLAAGALAAALVVCGEPSYAHAQASGARTPSHKPTAIELFEQSARAYREGRFQDAIDLLVEARRVKPEPVLLYNLGRAYEAMGRQTEAADAYAGYLAEDPRAADRRAIEGRITTLRSQAEQLDRAKNPPSPPEERRLPPELPPPEPQPQPQPSEIPIVVPIVIIAAGVAGLGAGVVLGLVAGSKHDAAVTEPTQVAAQDKQDRAESFATGSTVAFIAGGVVTAAGLAWLGIRILSSSSTTTARVSVMAGPCALLVRGTF